MYGLIINSAMDASKIHHRNRINTIDSLTSGHLPQLCSEIFSKTIKSFVGVQKRVKFAVNLQILSLAKFDVLPDQKTVKDCNIELMSALSNGCINSDEAMLGSGRQQKSRALNTSPNEIYKTRPELSLDSSKLCGSELDDFICYSLNSTVRRIAFLDHWPSFSEPRISYSDLLRLFCQNLSRAFNHNQNHLTSHCFHHSEDRRLAAKLGDHRHNMCAVATDEAVGIAANSSNSFSSRFSQDRSERNTDRLKMQSETTKIHASLACSDMKAECTKTESFATDSIYSNSSCCRFRMTATDKSGKVAVTQNSNYQDKNLSDFDPSPVSVNDAIIAMTDSSGQLANCPSSIQSTATSDKKARRHKHRHRQLHSVQQYTGWRSHRFCRKRNHRQSKSRTKSQHKSRFPVHVAGIPHPSVSSDNTCSDVEYSMEAETHISQRKEDLDMNLKLTFSDVAKDVLCAEGLQTCWEVRNYERDDNEEEDLADGTYCNVVDDEETGDETTDEENTDEEETGEDVLADDESNSASNWDEEITDEETDEEGKIELNGKATAVFAGGKTNNVHPTSAGIKTFCKSSFFISPSEMDSSDSSSDSDDTDDEDDDLEVDGCDSSEDQSADTLFSGICDSFSFNGLYFPSSCSAVEARLSLDELKENDRTRLLSASGSPSASPLGCSLVDNSCDDIVFCDDQESLSCASEDEEDLPLTNLSRLQSINARWNHFYSTPGEVEKPTQNKKQVRFPRDSSLVTTYAEAMSEAEDYAAARTGPWEEYARDRDRFTRRIRDAAEQISWVLSPTHRSEVYKNSFSKS